MTSDYEPTRWGRLASILLIATLLTGMTAWLLFLIGITILTWQQVIM